METLFQKGKPSFEKGKLQEAEARFNQILKESPYDQGHLDEFEMMAHTLKGCPTGHPGLDPRL
jgi:outer membrane protein assembly factor BamD (BamD/ComL family)